MKMVFAMVIFFLAGGCNAAESEVVLIGHFSNMKTTADADPHTISGYSVSVYQHEKTLFGNLAVATGSLEPAQGRLYDIKFDPATGRLRFKAKYITGQEYNKQTGPEGRQARELMVFSGTLKRKALAGTVVLLDGYDLDGDGEKAHVSMKKTRNDYKPASLAAWTTLIYLDAQW